MLKYSDIDSIKKNLENLPPEKTHKLLLLHLSVFSDFFLNIASYEDQVEKILGKRVGAKTLAPLSFIIINTIVYTYQNKNAPYHNEIVNMNLPIEEFINHPLFKFEYSNTSKRFSKNTIECISYNTNYPKETVRRQLKIWENIVPKEIKNRDMGYFFPFEIILDTDLFKKSHLWIAKKIGSNWSNLLDSLSELNYIHKNYKIDIDHLTNMNETNYFRTWVMLHWYWTLCFQYIYNSPLTYNEYCVLSSTLFFNSNIKNKIKKHNVDFYREGILKPVNLSSIADSTLIPRESVRRIVNTLIKKNILKKDKNKIYVSEFITSPKFLITSSDGILKNMIHDSLTIIINMFNPIKKL